MKRIKRCIISYFIFLLFTYLSLLYILQNYNIAINLESSYSCNYEKNSNINNQIYIYSANIINNKEIILIGVSYPHRKYKLYCKIYFLYYTKQCNISIKRVYYIYKHYNLTYIALYIQYVKSSEKPIAIRINKNIIPLLLNKPKACYNIILVIANFHSVYNYKQVIDVIEISRLLGVDHIVIYVTSSSHFIKSILYYYSNTKYVELIPFCINKEMKNVWATGQLEKMNDILYRYMHNTKFIIFNDIDEVIIPSKLINYMSFLREVDNYSSDMYIFKSKLFPYVTRRINSILKYKKCCYINKGCEKYIIGNLYKYSILDVHKYIKSNEKIIINRINESIGYVRHTRYRGNKCQANMKDNSLDYLEVYLQKFYVKFLKLFNNISSKHYYGKML